MSKLASRRNIYNNCLKGEIILVKKENNCKIYKNNSGFTMIELLISVAILALIVIPILNSFLMSARLNAKAKQKHKATIVAENIMEKLKANSLEDIEKWTDMQNLSTSDVRSYRLESFKDQGSQYNVQIKMDPTSTLYKNGTTKALINDYSFPVISEVYGNSNAIISQNDEDNVAATSFFQYNQAAHKDNSDIEEFANVEEVKQIMRKNMQILILPGTKSNHFIVESYFVYTCESPKLLKDDQTLELALYSKDIENLNTIYFFYDPLELNYTDTIHQDNLYVNNQAKAVANVYIVKRGETVASTSYLLDATFRMLNGKQVRGIIDYKTGGKPCLTFYSNLSQSYLGTVNLHYGEGTNTLAPKSGVKENRIYDVTVTIYKKGNWSTPLVEFTTTKEEW